MNIENCVSCGEFLEDGPALGRLCYHCIEKTVVDHIKDQELETKKHEARQADLLTELVCCFVDFKEAQEQLIEELLANTDPAIKDYGEKMKKKLIRKKDHYTKVLAAANDKL